MKLHQSLLSLLTSVLFIAPALRADTVYVANFYGGYIQKYTTSGSSGTLFADSLSAPEQMTFNADGDLLSANYGESRIMRFTQNGQRFVYVVTPGGADGVAIDSAGNVYIADYDGGTIWKTAPSDPTNAVAFATGIYGAVALAFDSSGNLYVSSHSGTSVQKYSSNGTFISQITGFSDPAGVAVDGAGNVYVADFGANVIKKYSSSGAFISNFGSGLNQPYMIAFDSQTNLFVSNYGNNNVVKITPDGTTSTFASINSPSSVAAWPGLSFTGTVTPPTSTNPPPPVVTNTPPNYHGRTNALAHVPTNVPAHYHTNRLHGISHRPPGHPRGVAVGLQ
jgi:streptogramin lyase